ncbi:MAG: 30S ribosomal protein S8 [Sphingomonadales bacterium]|nr:30S ribosomal protein S8 [Sphingomonadales bacterium]
MSMTDPLGDMLTRIRNGLQARKDTIGAPASNNRQRLLDVLEREGYIRGYERVEQGEGKSELKIMLKYHEGDPVISSLQRVSTPGRRVYSSVRDLPRVHNGLGISIISTPRGVLSDSEARNQNVGGEVLCTVF